MTLNLSSIPFDYRARVRTLAERAHASAVQAALRDGTDAAEQAVAAVRAVVARFERAAAQAAAADRSAFIKAYGADLRDCEAARDAVWERAIRDCEAARAAVWERAFATEEDGLGAALDLVTAERAVKDAMRAHLDRARDRITITVPFEVEPTTLRDGWSVMNASNVAVVHGGALLRISASDMHGAILASLRRDDGDEPDPLAEHLAAAADRQDAPAPLTEAEAHAWGTRIIGDGSVGIRALAVFVADALRALERGEVPPEVRAVDHGVDCPCPADVAQTAALRSMPPTCDDCGALARGITCDPDCPGAAPEPGPHTAGAMLLEGGLVIDDSAGIEMALRAIVAYLSAHIAAPPVDLVLQVIAALAATIPSGPLAPRDHVPAMLAAIETLLRAMPWERPASPRSLMLHARSPVAVQTLAAMPNATRATHPYLDVMLESAVVTVGDLEVSAQYSRPLTPEERDAAPSFGSAR